MKRWIAILLALSISLGCVGCGNHANSVQSVPTEASDSPSESTVPTESLVTEPPVTEPPIVELHTYPLNSDITYTKLAADLPDHIYNTLGSENGLAGTIYRITGTAEEYYTINSDGFVFEQLVVSTDKGNILITDQYKAIYNATVLEFGVEFTKAYYPYDIDNFIYPDVGETAHFIAVYMGYSETESMAIFTLGANPAIFQLLGYEDPAANFSSDTYNEQSSEQLPNESPTEEPTETIPVGTDYVLNTNTRKFHYPSCSSVGDIKESNKQTYTGIRDELIAQGYAPCGRCDP